MSDAVPADVLNEVFVISMIQAELEKQHTQELHDLWDKIETQIERLEIDCIECKRMDKVVAKLTGTSEEFGALTSDMEVVPVYTRTLFLSCFCGYCERYWQEDVTAPLSAERSEEDNSDD